MKKIQIKAFTLVELIIVITILAILGTIGFMSFQSYTLDARDSKRKIDLTVIRSGLEMYQMQNQKLPNPDDFISFSGESYQGYASGTTLKALRISDDTKDPKDNIYYTYSVDINKTKYQLLSMLENKENLAYNSNFNQAYAGVDYTSRYPYTIGGNFGIYLSGTTKAPVQEYTSIGTEISDTGGLILIKNNNSINEKSPGQECINLMTQTDLDNLNSFYANGNIELYADTNWDLYFDPSEKTELTKTEWCNNVSVISINNTPDTITSNLVQIYNLINAQIRYQEDGNTDLINKQNLFKELTNLNLGIWNITSIPNELFTLTNLKGLDLGSNQLTSLPTEIGNLTNLTYLNLYNNQLTSLPSTIGNLTNLKLLDLSSNNFITLPEELFTLNNLINLNLWSNQLINLSIEIGNLTNLQLLYLGGNKLTSLPTEIGNLTKLTDLDLSSTNLTIFPSELWNLSNLTDLDLQNNGLTSLPTEIGNLTNLISLHLASNISLGNLSFDFVTNTTSKTQTNITPDGKTITIVGNVSNIDIKVSEPCEQLLGDNGAISLNTFFNGSGYNGDKNYWCGLTSINASGKSLTGNIPSTIGNLISLTSLNLGNNQLTNIPSEIRNLINLISLDLYGNQLTSLPSNIWNLNNLYILGIGANQLTSLPSEIGNLTKLTSLSLESNQLTSLPSEIGNLTKLTSLSLYSNQLTSLPSEIGNLTKLTGLYLLNNTSLGNLAFNFYITTTTSKTQTNITPGGKTITIVGNGSTISITVTP